MQDNIRTKIRIGEVLVREKLISQQQLETAIAEQKKTGGKLGECIIRLGYLEEQAFLNFLSKQLKIPFIDLKKHTFDANVVRQLPESFARQFQAIILEKYRDGYLIGMVDPMDITAIDELSRVLKKPLYLALVRETELLRTLDLNYRRTSDISHLAEQLQEQLVDDQIELSQLSVDAGNEDVPVIQLIQSMFQDAVQVGASDIHIEPARDRLSIRQRVDGILQEQVVKEKNIAAALTLRLKLMAGLNIAEKRLPQDGRFSIRIREREIDVRLSALPTQYGESVVMRLLNQGGSVLDLHKLGMPDDIRKRFEELMKLPHGLILVTGPTGSGKSTTLYTGLQLINSPDKKIITVEDPVEYRMVGVNQVQVNPLIELTFARVLRTALRQDPDVLLVGEMRDQETAEIAIRAALTGHLVLSTLHTNDSASSAMRLIDMGIPGYLVAATLRAVLAQRLIRRICDSCRQGYPLKDREKMWLEQMLKQQGDDISKHPPNYSHGIGCPYCNGTGYQGRIGIYELLELDRPLMEKLIKNDPAGFVTEASQLLRGRLLFNESLALAEKQVTTISEVVRIVGYQ